jgi:hypothetical protein
MKLLLAILLLHLTINTNGQTATNTRSGDLTNVYNLSLKAYLDFRFKRDSIHIDTLYIEHDFKITDSLMPQVGQTKLIQLNMEDVKKLLERKKGFRLYRIFPLHNEKKLLAVSFVPFGVTKREEPGKIGFSNPGSYWIFFKFRRGRFKLVRVEDHGI